MENTEQENIDTNERIKNEKLVEATLFIAAKFLSLQELVAITGINPLTLKQTLLTLQEKYSVKKSYHFFQNWREKVFSPLQLK